MSLAECRACIATIAPLVDRAESLMETIGASQRARESFALARRAFREWQAAKTEPEASKWITVFGNRCVVAALDMHLSPAIAGSADIAIFLIEMSLASETAAERLHVPAAGGAVAPAVLASGPPMQASPPVGVQPHLAAIQDESFAPTRPTPPPPALIGPLAGTTTPSPEPQPETPPIDEAAPVHDEAPLLERYPLARCAAIAASIARRKDDKSAILEKNELTADRWSELDRHWNEAVRQDSQRGKATLLAEYDEAYIAQLEKERGPITVEAFAKLSISSERGTEASALAELDLPKGAVPRLQRLWLRKTALDRALGKRLRAAIEEQS